MKHPFINLIKAALFTVAAASARADAVKTGTVLDTPVALSLSTADFLTPTADAAFAAPTGLFSSGDPGYYALGGAAGFAAAPGRTWETFSTRGPQVSAVALPEPSSGTALYFLSGAAGLALVVMRRRTLA